MCFSDTASFAVAAACAVAGAYAVLKSPSAKYLPLAVVPGVFGLQQLSEGLVWHAIGPATGTSVSGLPSTLFVFIATVFWPIFVPLAVLVAQDGGHRKRIIRGLAFVGSLVSLVYAVRLLNADVMASVVGASIQYTSQIKPGALLPVWLLSEAQGGSDWILVPYALATIGSLGLSTLPALRYFAGLVLIALVFLMVVNQTTLVSVWCFFAASGSLLIVPAIQSARLKYGTMPARAAFASRRVPGGREGL